MNTGQIIKSRLTEKFTVVPNEIARSIDLTIEEKGLLIFLLSLPSDWVIYKTNLHENMGEQKGTIDRVWKQLKKKGYILSVKVLSDGKFVGWNHVVYDTPTVPDSIEIRHGQTSTSINVDVDKSLPILSTDINTKKEVLDTKKEYICDFEEFIAGFNGVRKAKFRESEAVFKKFIHRMKDGYTVEEMLKALKNAMDDSFHKENNFKYLTPEFFTRQDKLDRWLNSGNTTSKPKTPPV